MKNFRFFKRITRGLGQKPTLGAGLFLGFFSVSVFVLYFYVTSTAQQFTSLNSLLKHYENRKEISTQLQQYDHQLTLYTLKLLDAKSASERINIKDKYSRVKTEFDHYLEKVKKNSGDSSTRQILEDLERHHQSLAKLEAKIFQEGGEELLRREYLKKKALFSKSLIAFSQNLRITEEKREGILDFFAKYDAQRRELMFLIVGFWAIFSSIFYYINYMRARTLKNFNMQNRFLETLINQIPSGVVAVDRGGKFTLWNRAATKILGKTDINSPVDGWPDLYRLFKNEGSEKSVSYHELPLYRALKGARVSEEELVIKRTDGNLTISCFAAPLYDEYMEGEIDGAVVIFSDISAQKKLEEERQKNFHASKMATLGEVSGNLAHEINTPLCTVKLASEIIHIAIKEKDLNKVQHFIGSVDGAIERMSSIVDGFKKYSRQEKLEPDFQIMSLNYCLEESLKLCSIDFSHREIDVIQNYDREDNILCECAPTLMVQLFVNLFVNAKDAISELDEKWIEISMTREKGKAVVKIKDSGKGIDRETVNRMFDPFFTTKDFGKGTGMGLGMVRNIALTHRGSVYYKLEDGHTCFVYEMDLFYEKELKEAS